VDGSREGLTGDKAGNPVSKVEVDGKLIFASASARQARTKRRFPTIQRPMNLNLRHAGWDCTPAGTRASSLTMESSSPVIVTGRRASVAHGGIGASAASREIAKTFWQKQRVRVAGGDGIAS